MADVVALSIAAAWIWLVALATGLLLVRRMQIQRGPPHPFVSAFVSGLLIGISVLVLLPEPLEQLPADGWTSAQVLVLFLSSSAAMYGMDFVVMTHQHAAAGERIPGAVAEPIPTEEDADGATLDAAVWKAKADEVPAWVSPANAKEDGSPPPQAMSRSETDEPAPALVPAPAPAPAPAWCESSHEAVLWCPCHGGDPFAKGGGFGGFSFNLQPKAQVCPPARRTPPCPRERPSPHERPSPPPSPAPSPPAPRWESAPVSAPEDLEAGRPHAAGTWKLLEHLRASSSADDAATASPRGRAARGPPVDCRRASAVCVRVCAWMLHAMIDGMVLASAPSTGVLLATTLPITFCAMQDVAAFTMAIARIGVSSRRALTVAAVALSCAFPTGALVGHLALERASSETAVNVARAAVAGIFAYMALFELAPPHTHSRAANACYLLCFTCGAAMAYAADMAQQLAGAAAPES